MGVHRGQPGLSATLAGKAPASRMGLAILMDMLRDWGHNERKHRAREVGRCDSVCRAQRHQRQAFGVRCIPVAKLWGLRGTGEASTGIDPLG